MSEYTPSSESGRRMLGYLPPYYATSRVMGGILQAQGVELDNLKQALNETLEQFFVETATWGLDAWEKELGIPGSSGKPYDQRRSVIQSRLRGVGTVTIDLIHNVATAYERGSVEVTEQPSLYQITIRFVDTLGTPPNLDDLKAAIENVKPAHLAVVYQYKYLLVNQLHGMKISELHQRALTDFAPVIPL